MKTLVPLIFAVVSAACGAPQDPPAPTIDLAARDPIGATKIQPSWFCEESAQEGIYEFCERTLDACDTISLFPGYVTHTRCVQAPTAWCAWIPERNRDVCGTTRKACALWYANAGGKLETAPCRVIRVNEPPVPEELAATPKSRD